MERLIDTAVSGFASDRLPRASARVGVYGQVRTLATSQPLAIGQFHPGEQFRVHGSLDPETTSEHSQWQSIGALGMFGKRESTIHLDNHRTRRDAAAQCRGGRPWLAPSFEIREPAHSASRNGCREAVSSSACSLHPTTPLLTPKSTLEVLGRNPRPLTSTSRRTPFTRPCPSPRPS